MALISTLKNMKQCITGTLLYYSAVMCRWTYIHKYFRFLTKQVNIKITLLFFLQKVYVSKIMHEDTPKNL